MLLTRMFWIFAISAGVQAAISATKGFYCRDPDTGKLYPANSTWLSTTFCGSYTCILRKRNLTGIETNNSFIQTNIKTKNLQKVTTKNLTKDNDFAKMIPLSKENVTRQEIKALLRLSQEQNKKVLTSTEKQDPKTSDGASGNDRYLSESEVKTLSAILKNMKKSDLEAILEVYSLAQDIYKEIDKDSDENIVVEAFKTFEDKKESNKGNNRIGKSKGNKEPNFWYEPLSAPRPKDTFVTAAVHVKSNAMESLKDMNFEGSQLQPHIAVAYPYVDDPLSKDLPSHTHVHDPIPKDLPPHIHVHDPISKPLPPHIHIQFQNPKPLPPHDHIHDPFPKPRPPHIHVHDPIPKPLPQAKENPYLSERPNEFKLPYYYPITNFQRVASYVHPAVLSVPTSYVAQSQTYPPPTIPTSTLPPMSPKSTCNHAHKFTQPELPYWYRNMMNKNQNPEPIHHALHIHVPVENKPIKTPAHNAMPYPAEYAKYNYSGYYPYGDLWKFFDLKSHRRSHRPHVPPPSGTVYAAEVPNSFLLNPEIHEEVQGIEQTPIKENEMRSLLETIASEVKKPVKERLFPDWLTEDRKLLKDTKTNIKDKLAPFYMNNNVNLDRVGKVIKIDEMSRHKRATENVSKDKTEVVEEYEVIINKSTCETDMEPGFFRVGNETQPYPACCPQRIFS